MHECIHNMVSGFIHIAHPERQSISAVMSSRIKSISQWVNPSFKPPQTMTDESPPLCAVLVEFPGYSSTCRHLSFPLLAHSFIPDIKSSSRKQSALSLEVCGITLPIVCSLYWRRGSEQTQAVTFIPALGLLIA